MLFRSRQVADRVSIKICICFYDSATHHSFNRILFSCFSFIGADVDMNRANEVRPVFRKLGMIAEKTGCAIVLIGHLNKSSGTQSTYRGLGSIEISFLSAISSLISFAPLSSFVSVAFPSFPSNNSSAELDEKAKEQGISGRTMRDVRSRMKNELEYQVNEKQENSIRLKE